MPLLNYGSRTRNHKVIRSEERKTAYNVWKRMSQGTLDGIKMMSWGAMTDPGLLRREAVLCRHTCNPPSPSDKPPLPWPSLLSYSAHTQLSQDSDPTLTSTRIARKHAYVYGTSRKLSLFCANRTDRPTAMRQQHISMWRHLQHRMLTSSWLLFAYRWQATFARKARTLQPADWTHLVKEKEMCCNVYTHNTQCCYLCDNHLLPSPVGSLFGRTHALTAHVRDRDAVGSGKW